MKALKVLVVLMGVLILAGLAVVAITVAKRAGAPTDGARPGAPTSPVPPLAGAPAPGFGETVVPIPDGFAVAETRTEGGRLIVRLQAPDGRARIVLLDLASGRVLGTVVLRPGAAAPAR